MTFALRTLSVLAVLPLLGSSPTEPRSAIPTATAPAAEGGPRERWLALPEVVEPAALRAGLLDQPESYCVIDVRSDEQYREFHVPHAVSAGPDTILDTIRAQPVDTRIVLVDRDGTQAYAVAGAAHVALGAAARPLRVLAGGTARYWREIVMPTRSLGTPAVPSGSIEVPPRAVPATPVTKKPRSAGC